MELIRNFKELNKNDAPIAGGKGASLGEMTQVGIPVPPGFVVLSSTFDQFIKDADLVQEIDAILDKVDHKEIHTVENASEQIQGLIKNATMPESISEEIQKQFKDLNSKYVAVRSSATAEDGAEHAWAGQLDSFLNTTEKDLLEKVQHCWASLFTPRAIFYRFEKGLHTTQISVAVVVQKMVNSEISGIAFSVHPVTEDRNQLIIEAGFGLGEAIVSGQVTPNSYVVEKEPRRIIDKNVNTQARALYRVGGGGNEWRDISEPQASSQALNEAQILELSEIVIGIENHYGLPCDIEWAYEDREFYVVQSRPITTLREFEVNKYKPNFQKLLSRKHCLLADEIIATAWNDQERFVSLTGFPDYVKYLEIVDGDFYFDFKWVDGIIGKYKDSDLKIFQDFINNGYAHGEIIKNYSRNCMSAHSKDGLIAQFEESTDLLKNLLVFLPITHPLVKIIEGKVVQILREKGVKDEELDEALFDASTPIKKNTTVLENEDLLKIKEAYQNNKDFNLDQAFEKHSDDYGFLGYREPFSGGYDKKFFEARLTDQNTEAKQHKISSIKFTKDEQKYVDLLKEFVYFRTYRTEKLYESLYYLEPLWKKIAQEFGLKNEIDVGWYILTDVYNLFRSGDRVADFELDKRKIGHAILLHNNKIEIVFADEMFDYKKKYYPEQKSGVNKILGVAACKGKVAGIAKVVTSSKDQDKIKQGDVLVTAMTTPDFLPSMNRAAAFVTDEGGITCHAAIVAREMNKPCIIGTKIATQVLKDGDLVEVDANNGVVRVRQNEKAIAKGDETGLAYGGDEWFMTITRNMSFWHQYLSNEGHFHHTEDFGVDAKLRILQITKKGTETSVFMCNPNYGEYSEAVIDATDTKKAVDNLKKKYFELADKVVLALDEAKKNLNKSSLALFIDEYRRFTAGLMITATLGRSGSERLIARLKELGYKDEEISEINAVITYPKEHTPLFNSQLDLIKIGAQVQDGKSNKEKIDDALLKWLQKNEYIPVNFCEEPWNINNAREQLSSFLKKNCKEEHKIADEGHKMRVKKAKRLLDKIDDEEVDHLAYALAEGTYLNEFRKNIFSKISLGYREIFEKIALSGGSKNWRDCFYITSNEMLDIVSGKKIYIPDIVAERQVMGVYINKKGESLFLDKENTNKFFEYTTRVYGATSHKQPLADKSFKGSIANKGVVRGVAKIILGSKDFHKLNIGEILVTTMTSVDFVPVMERAAAFVTNEGGITSHASIVAREMNKPCIIGTKIATQVLKDGDMVEVDADNGVVRILEKARDHGQSIAAPKIKEKISNDAVDGTELIVKYLPLIKDYTLWPPLMNFCPFVHSSLWNCRKFFDPYYKNKKRYDCINFIKKGESFYTLTAEKLIANSEEIFAAYLKDHGIIKKRHKILFGRIAEMDKLYNKLSYAFIKKSNNDDLLPYIEKIWNILWDASASVQFAVHFEKDFCLKELRKNKFQISLEEFNEIWDKSLECNYNSFDKEQQLFFYNLIIKKVKWAEIVERCQYFYSGYDGARLLTEVEQELRKDYKDIKNISDAKNKLKNEERKLDGKITEYLKWYKKLNKRQQAIVDYVQEIIHMRDVRKNFFAKGIVVNWRIAEKIFDDAGVPHEFIRYYTFQEIMKGAGYLKKHKQELIKRENGFALLVHYSGKTEVAIQNYSKSKEIIDDYYLKQEKDRQKDENVLNGQTGSPGVVRGMVRIMLNISEANKFQEGEVLVAGMTRPEYASIMKKAVAIITDEGGITCHAAIVARELKVPCVIGTKLATKILKDGDLVEVDANNGVVKILEKAK